MTPVDSAFLKAIDTIKGLARGPNAIGKSSVDRRVRLYGLYKQATEGNVEGILPRPEGTDAGVRASQANWDAWKSQEGVSKQSAKLEYVRFLIESMLSVVPPELRVKENQPPKWLELQQAYEQAKQYSNTHDEMVEDQAAPSYNPGHNNSNHMRRMSIGSATSSYSHFLRNSGMKSPAVRHSTYSEFGLSEKDKSEMQADQLVNRMQSAYPPILPGAVVPEVLPMPTGLGMNVTPQSHSQGQNSPQRHLYDAFSDAPAPVEDPSGLASLVKKLLTHMRKQFTSTANWILHSIAVDTLKVIVLLSLLRLIASKPDIMRHLPISKKIATAVGKMFVVLLDEYGIELKWKGRPQTRVVER